MVAVRASHCLGKLVPLLPPESPLRAGSRATATVGREAAAWRAVAETSGAGAHPGVWELAWPTIVSNLLFSASGFIDIKIVGSLGASAVAAITTGTRIFFTAQAVLMAILAGTTALVARAWGAGDRAEAARIAELSLWLCLVVSALLTLGGTLGADALAGLFRLEPQTVALAARFTRWLSVFYVAFAVIMALSTALRAAGDVVTPLWIGALGNVVSVFFTYSLVHGAFGLPALGVVGAAIGNGMGFVTGALLLTALWRSGRLVMGTRGARAFRWELIQRLVRIGYPAAFEQVAWQGGFVAFLWFIALYGTAPYAAYGIGCTLLSFSFVVGFGFSVAASTVVGQRLGARDPEGATRGGWRAMRQSPPRPWSVNGSVRGIRRVPRAVAGARCVLRSASCWYSGLASPQRRGPSPRFSLTTGKSSA